jgi:hypothetical protein
MLMPLMLFRRGWEQIVSKSPNIRYWLGIAWIVCQAPVLWGQNLRLSSASASRGDQITIELSLESPAGKEPLALQWEAKVPVAISPIDEKSFTDTTTAKQAGKALHCAVNGKSADSYTARCILAGGQKPIPNGSVGLLRLRIPMDAAVGTVRIRVENASAVSRDSKAISLAPVETLVTVRK